ncbi:glutamyl-tRNA reductase [Georgenia sp. 10Sc9-8]|uniref:Glutamyl-tRNA reductase n=1 Tax=Georgenia halotolerans TaxID=3028317 RepID=A0ABT5TZJ4_9MICO|nr:glutamyl-tRNA reductase [Georgenia halotolerans]
MAALLLISAHHHDVDLADVEALSVGAEGLPAALAGGAVRGVVTLATCNRLEVYVETDDVATAVPAVHRAVAAASGVEPERAAALLRQVDERDAVAHLFAVAAGLDSMVVGEREITGQVRRALQAARRDGTASPLLERLFQHAARTAREVALGTDLARAGRSVVSVALDLAAAHAERCSRDVERPPQDPATGPVPRAALDGTRALLVGTGSYAGASLAALRERGCTEVVVWSASDRAPDFAARHGIEALPSERLLDGLTTADLVLTCRGTGATVLDVDLVDRAMRRRSGPDPLVVLDLALHRDVDPAVAGLEDVVHLDLATVRQHTPEATAVEIERARALVDGGVRRFHDDVAARAMDRAVVALREHVEAAVADELARLPAGQAVPADRVERALRRLAARLTHEPTVRARSAGREGRAAEHLEALEQALGLGVRPDAPSDADASVGTGSPADAASPVGADRYVAGSPVDADAPVAPDAVPDTWIPADVPADLRGPRP